MFFSSFFWTNLFFVDKLAHSAVGIQLSIRCRPFATSLGDRQSGNRICFQSDDQIHLIFLHWRLTVCLRVAVESTGDLRHGTCTCFRGSSFISLPIFVSFFISLNFNLKNSWTGLASNYLFRLVHFCALLLRNYTSGAQMVEIQII